MKYVVIALMSLSVVGCGTLGGAVTGAGQDLQKVGGWIQNK
jgi:predicted small secreted protein